MVAFWFVAGLVGRDVALAKAQASEDLEVVSALAEQAGRFDRLMVTPGSMAVLVLGLVTAWVQGRSFRGPSSGWLLTSLILLSVDGPDDPARVPAEG